MARRFWTKNNIPVPTYNQAIVTNMARVLTGWTYPTDDGATAKTNNPAYYTGQMFAVEIRYDRDRGNRFFANIDTIPAGQNVEQDLPRLASDAPASLPTMAPFTASS